MDQRLIVVGLILFVVGAVWLGLHYARRQSRNPAPPPDANLIDARSTGEGQYDADQRPPPSRWQRLRTATHKRWRLWRERSRSTPRGQFVRLLGVLLIAAMLTTSLWLIPVVAPNLAPNRFYVLVAPFASPDPQTGQAVAADLVALLEQTHPALTVRRLNQAPADPAAAVALAQARNADVVIWGRVPAGAMLDQPTLTVELVYMPSGLYAPAVWSEYGAAFSMPHYYPLTSAPINGRAVLPPLIAALHDYSAGQPDRAAVALEMLLQEYPLAPILPQALLGNILWARGAYDQAADAYRRSLAAAAALDPPLPEYALLTNNLGAILVSAGNPAAPDVLGQAVAQLRDQGDLAALRFNLGRLAELDRRRSDAVTQYEIAHNLQPDDPVITLALARAYRDTGQLAAVEEALSAAAGQVGHYANRMPADLRPLTESYLQSLLAEQRGLLALAEVIDARAPIAWELELAPVRPADEFNLARDYLREAVQISDALENAWRAQAAAVAAADDVSGATPNGQAEQAERLYDRQRYHLALVLIEQSRDVARQSNGFLDAFDTWFGEDTSARAGEGLLLDLIAADADDVEALVALARALRLHGDSDEARRRYNQLVGVAGFRPEGYYGLGRLEAEAGRLDQAAAQFAAALERNALYFPARDQLARVAEAQGNWDLALEQLRFLAEQLPGSRTGLELANSLRRSGPDTYAEAEQVLTDLVAQGNVAAQIELGRLYRVAGYPADAVRVLRAARDAAPRSAEAAYQLGLTLLEAGNLAAAAEQFQTAIALDDAPIDAYLRLAALYDNPDSPLFEPDAAVVVYRAAIDTGRAEPAQLASIGDSLLALEDPQLAATAFRRGIEQQSAVNRADPYLHYALARAFLARGFLSGAAEEVQTALALTTNTADPAVRRLRADTLILQGDVYRRQQQPDRAAASYAQALALDPNAVDAMLGQGLLYTDRNQWGVARAYFEQARALPGGASDALANFWLAEALLRQPDYSRAAQLYAQAIDLRRRNFPAAWLGLAQVQAAVNDRRAALASLEKALEVQPDYAEALLFYGKLLQEAGLVDEALAAYNQAIDANRGLAEAYFRRALIYMQTLDYQRAARDLRRATALQPSFADAHYWLGRAYFIQDRSADALLAFERAISLQNDRFPEAQLYQGLALESQGLINEAIESFQAVIQADASGVWAERARTELNQMLR